MKKIILPVVLASLFQACTFYDTENDFDERDRIVGHYDVEEYSETYGEFTYYDMYVSKTQYGSRVYFENFYAAGLRVYAFLDYGVITIPYQVADGYEIEGSGTVHGNELDLYYSVNDRYSPSWTDHCETHAWLEY